MREPTKDFEIGGRTYRVEKLTALDGAWLAFLLMARMKTPDIRDALAQLSEADFKQIADKVLAKTTVVNMETNLPVPVRHASGQIVDPELAGNAKAMFDLIFQAIAFNLAPFFEQGAEPAQ